MGKKIKRYHKGDVLLDRVGYMVEVEEVKTVGEGPIYLVGLVDNKGIIIPGNRYWTRCYSIVKVVRRHH